MGFFSKVFKGIKKVFKKIGRGIKSVVGKVGKMFGKLGIVGQIGLGLLLPGVGQVLSGMIGSVGGALAGSSSALLQSAGKFIQGAIEIGGRVGNAFSSVTEGVTKVIGETVGAVANNLGLRDPILSVTKGLGLNSGQGIDVASKSFGNIWDTTQTAMSDAINAGKDIFSPLSSSASTGVMTPEFQKARILEAKKAGIELPEWDKVVDISEVATDKTLGYTPSPMDALQEIQVTAQKIPTAQPSLLGQLGTAIKKVPGKLGTAAVEAVQEFPTTVVDKAGSALTSGVVSKGMQKLGLEQAPEYTTEYYAASIPTIDMSGTTDIGMYGQTSFDPVSYMANNMDSINMNPWGFNANIYNAATYQNAMRQYGYA